MNTNVEPKMPKLMSDHDSDQLDGPWVGYVGAHEHTGLSLAWLHELVMEKRIPFRKVGKRVLFSVPALDQWINRNGEMEGSGAEPQETAPAA